MYNMHNLYYFGDFFIIEESVCWQLDAPISSACPSVETFLSNPTFDKGLTQRSPALQ